MAEIIVPSQQYQPRQQPYTFEVTPNVDEIWVECELLPTQWQSGRTVDMKVEYTNDGGVTWKHAAGGTWIGPQPSALGNPQIGVTLLAPSGRVDYHLRGSAQLSGGSIRTGIRLTTSPTVP